MEGVRVTWLLDASGLDAAARLLQAEVGRTLSLPVGEVEVRRLCPRCGGSDHGRPVVVRRDGGPAPFVSLSRADGAVIVAVSDAGPVGVDLERIDAARFSGFPGVALHPAEHASSVEEKAVVWTRKESLLKATGDGLHIDPRSIRVSDPGQPPRLLEWSGRPDVPRLQMSDLDVAGHAACVTVLTDLDVSITTRRAAPADLSQ